MNEITYVVSNEQSGITVGGFLRRQDISTGMIRRLKQTDGIWVNERSVTVRHVLQAGDALQLRIPKEPTSIVPVAMPLDIEYEDDWILVVNKPSGMPTHPSHGHHSDTLANGVVHYLQNTAFSFHPITRLDRYTAGLTLIAKNAVAAAHLSRQVKEGAIQKTYYAVTDGIPTPLAGQVDLPIGRVEGSVIKRQVTPDGKPALTRYSTVKTREGTALLKVQPVTGRTHQIRVHMAAIGCPLLYDFLYGKEQEGKFFLLTCAQLDFEHPENKERMSIKIPLEKFEF